jgi:hypothetical protein
MGSARGSSSGLTRASGLAHPRMSGMVRPVPISGIAPAPGLRPPGPFSQPNARGSPLIPLPTTYQDRQADHLPHLLPPQRSSRTVRDHASPKGQRRDSQGNGPQIQKLRPKGVTPQDVRYAEKSYGVVFSSGPRESIVSQSKDTRSRPAWRFAA